MNTMPLLEVCETLLITVLTVYFSCALIQQAIKIVFQIQKTIKDKQRKNKKR